MIKTFPFKSCLWKNAAQNPFSIKKLSAQNPGTILCSMVLCRLSLVRRSSAASICPEKRRIKIASITKNSFLKWNIKLWGLPWAARLTQRRHNIFHRVLCLPTLLSLCLILLCDYFLLNIVNRKTLPRAQHPWGLSSACQSILMCHTTSSNTNLNQAKVWLSLCSPQSWRKCWRTQLCLFGGFLSIRPHSCHSCIVLHGIA